MKKIKEKKDNLECPFCHKLQTVKYGKYKNTQKYKCKSCERIFKEKNYVIKEKNEKKLVSVLLNLTKIAPDDITGKFKLSNLLPDGKFDEKAFKNISVAIQKVPGNHESIKCKNPKIIIYLDGDTINIIRLPDYNSRTAKNEHRGITTLINEDTPCKKFFLEDISGLDVFKNFNK